MSITRIQIDPDGDTLVILGVKQDLLCLTLRNHSSRNTFHAQRSILHLHRVVLRSYSQLTSKKIQERQMGFIIGISGASLTLKLLSWS
ncbi:hypothetical protein FOCG_18345 [Fusarium oxysporum f. sp. radicis-lycopersici 26381]|nr:hypothetical protein FOCG_18345 [Fusarium oxysporum f. sp. radicis-lycopersici 26381]